MNHLNLQKAPQQSFKLICWVVKFCPLFGVLLTCQFISNLASVGSVEKSLAFGLMGSGGFFS